MKLEYLVVYERGEHDWSGFVPDVPGCISTAASMEELREGLGEALTFHLEGLSLDHAEVPSASTHVIEVPEGGAAEWLAVELPVREAVTV